MATTKEVRVVINGEEYVSAAAKKAGDGMDGFAKKTPSWVTAAATLVVAYQAITRAIGQVREFIMDSFAAYDALGTSQRKLEGTSKLTGLALEDLQKIAETGRAAFGLSAISANDFAVEVAKLARNAGETDKAAEALKAFLDIGAARGLTASQTLTAVQQSLLGIDEGTDKLFGKNPSGLWADYALVIGKAAGKFNDADKAAALLHAALDGGKLVLGSYAEFLETTRGKLDLYDQKVQESQSMFGRSIDAMRAGLVDVGGTTVPWFYDQFRKLADGITATSYQIKETILTFKAFAASLRGDEAAYEQYSKELQRVSDLAIEFQHRAKTSAAGLAAENSKLTGSYADVIKGTDKAKDAFGGIISPLDKATDLFNKTADAVDGIGPRAGKTATAVANLGKVTVENADKGKKATVDAGEAANKALDKWETDHGKLSTAVWITTTAIDDLGESARTQLSQEQIGDFVVKMQELANRSRDVADELGKVPEPVARSAKETQKMVSDVADIARTALDAAQAFGVMDDKAASALNSAINIASSLGKLAGGDFAAGLSGIVAGIGNIVSTMINGDPERRRLLRDNNTQLEKLRREGVHLSTSASGETISKAKGVFAPGFAEMLAGIAKSGGNAMNPLLQGLAGAGLTVSDLDAIAKDLGINIRNKDGGIDFAALQQLVSGLQMPGFGSRIDNSFGSQLDFFRDSQKLSGASGVGEISDLVTYLRNVGGVSALEGVDFSDPTQARNKLFEIFTSLNNQSLDPASLGELTGDQFRDLLFEMIQGLTGDTGTTGAPVIDISGGGGTGGVVDIPGVGTVSVSVGDVVTTALEAQTAAMAPMLEQANVFASRTADATEGTWYELREIHNLLRSADFTGTVNARLEEMRQAEAAYKGEGLRF